MADVGVTVWFTEAELEAVDDALGAAFDQTQIFKEPENFARYRTAYEKVHRAFLNEEDRR